MRLLNTGELALNPANVVHLQADPAADRVIVTMVGGSIVNISSISYAELVIQLNEAMRG